MLKTPDITTNKIIDKNSSKVHTSKKPAINNYNHLKLEKSSKTSLDTYIKSYIEIENICIFNINNPITINENNIVIPPQLENITIESNSPNQICNGLSTKEIAVSSLKIIANWLNRPVVFDSFDNNELARAKWLRFINLQSREQGKESKYFFLCQGYNKGKLRRHHISQTITIIEMLHQFFPTLFTEEEEILIKNIFRQTKKINQNDPYENMTTSEKLAIIAQVNQLAVKILSNFIHLSQAQMKYYSQVPEIPTFIQKDPKNS